jgi:hypothetical protein
MNDVEWNRLADLADEYIGPREEDVKFKVVAPILRLLGFTDLDFSFETPADLGRMDIVVKGFPVGVVVECKRPDARLEDCVSQVERYVRETMTRAHAAMVAVLTNGRRFLVYGLLGPIHKNEIENHVVLAFSRAQLKEANTQSQLLSLLSRSVVGGRSGDVRGTIESALRIRYDTNERRAVLIAQQAKLMEQVRQIDDELRALASASLGDTNSNGGALTDEPVERFKWGKEYAPQETVSVWMSELLERLAPPGSNAFVQHATLSKELCAFLSSRGTARAKALSEGSRLKIACNMIDWVTASWTRALGGKDGERMRMDPGAKADAPDWLREFTGVWTRKQINKWAFRRR